MKKLYRFISIFLFSFVGFLSHAQNDDLRDAYQRAQAAAQEAKSSSKKNAGQKKDAQLFELVIYHTSDIHGYIGPTPANPDKGVKASGGAASLATLLKGETRPHLWIDSGDWFQGTPEGNFSRGEAVIEVFNALGLTAGVLGNHDFDYGEDAVKNLASKAKFAVLGSNIASAKTGQGVGYVRPTVPKKVRKGVAIGIFGLITQHMGTLSFPEHIQGLQFGREADAAKAAVQELKSQGAGVVIAATHIGIEEYDGKVFDGIKEGDIYLAKNVPGIDLILGGHFHVPMKKPVIVTDEKTKRQTMITQSGSYLRSVYRIVLHIDQKTGGLDHAEAKLIDLDPAVYPPDPDTEKIVAKYKALVDKEMGREIGSSRIAMPKPRGEGGGESLLGNWITDILRRYGKTEIALINTLGIRGDLPKGRLTYGDIYKIMSFDNRVVKLKIAGSELRKLVEQNLGESAVFLQYSGLEIVFDPKAPEGQRLKTLKAAGSAVEDQKTYTVTTADFVATVDKAFMGDGQSRKKIEKEITDKDPMLIRDLLVKEVQDTSPVTSSLDGRIKTQ